MCAELRELTATSHGNKSACLQVLFTVCPYSITGLPSWVSHVGFETCHGTREWIWWPLKIPSCASYSFSGFPSLQSTLSSAGLCAYWCICLLSSAASTSRQWSCNQLTERGFRITAALKIRLWIGNRTLEVHESFGAFCCGGLSLRQPTGLNV